MKISDNLYKSFLLQSKKKVSGEIFKEPFLDILLTDLEQSSFSLIVPNLKKNVANKTLFSSQNKVFVRSRLEQKKLLFFQHFLTSSLFDFGGIKLKTSDYLFTFKKWIDKDLSEIEDISLISNSNTKKNKEAQLFKTPQQKLGKQNIENKNKTKLSSNIREFLLEMALKKSRKSKLSNSLQEIKPISCLLQIGDYVNSGDRLGHFFGTPIIISESGKVLKISQTQVTIQKMQPVLFYSQAEIHVKSNEWVKRGTPLLTLAHQTLVTGDIVQGIPRIEQLFEASTSCKNEAVATFPGADSQDLNSDYLDDFSISPENKILLRKRKKKSSLDNYFKSQQTSHLLPLSSSLTEIRNENVSRVNIDTTKFVEGTIKSNNMFLEGQKISITDLYENGEKRYDSTMRSVTENKPLFLYQTLQSQVREIFRKKWDQLPLPAAVRQSLEEIQQTIVESIQKVYISQGVLIADKHIEIIVRQMTSKAQVFDGGSTGLLIDEILSLQQIENANISTPGQKALYLPVVMGLTQAALSSDSFVSAASFQETTRVLSRDAVAGKTDFLRGLKEKVIIGDLIDAGTGLDVFYIYSLFSKTIFENKFRDILNRKVTHKTLKKLVLTVVKCYPNNK
ncbi:hypothetical protein EON70_00600 [bacterium]|nr:MAG: hypothetical protein EON70_00600 [bacterium]